MQFFRKYFWKYTLRCVFIFLVTSFFVPLAIAEKTKNLPIRLFSVVSPENPFLSKFNDGKMHIIFCGTGDPQVSMFKIREPSCLAIILNQKFFLIDAGENSDVTLVSLGIPFTYLKSIFITHLHADHIAGLGGVLQEYQLEEGRKGNCPIPLVSVYGPWGIQDVIKGIRKIYTYDALYRSANDDSCPAPQLIFGTPHLILPHANGQVVYDTKELKVTAFPVDHRPVYPAFGYELQYGGCKVVVSGDTRVDNALKLRADHANLLINEAFSQHFSELVLSYLKKINDPRGADYIRHINSYHSNSVALAKMAEVAKVQNLILTHLVPPITTTNAAKKFFTEGMSEYYKGNLNVADDGDEAVLSSTNGACSIQFISVPQPDIKAYQLLFKPIQ